MVNSPKIIHANSARADAWRPNTISIHSLFRFAKRNLLLSILICGVFATLGLLYGREVNPLYRAYTRLLIDPGQFAVLPHQAGLDLTRENLIIDSELEVIRSRELLAKVADLKGLYNGVDNQRPGLVQRIRGLINETLGIKSSPPDPEGIRRSILEGFKAQVDVSRVGLTFVIQISSSAGDPFRAADLTNAIAEEYIRTDLESIQDKARRSGDWLKTNLDQLRAEVIAAEEAATSFKLQKDMISASGGLIEDQQLTELSSKVGAARSETAQALARYKTIAAMAASGSPDVAVGDILNSAAITRLRKEYEDVILKSADTEARFGPNHPASAKYKEEVASLLQLMRNEIGRIADSAKSDYEIALTRQASLENSLETLKQAAMRTSENQVRLRELERRATSARNLYQDMLGRLQEAEQGASVPNSRARVIERASVPLGPIWPNQRLILLLSLVMGGAAACGIGLLRELLNDRVQSEFDMEAATSSSCLGMIPRLDVNGRKRRHERRAKSQWPKPHPRIIDGSADQLHHLLNDKLSHLAHVLRTVRLTLHIENGQLQGQCFAFSSTYPGEGKSTLTALQAMFLAGSGARTLLIDADITNPALTRRLTPSAETGLLDLVSNAEKSSRERAGEAVVVGGPVFDDVADFIWRDERTGLDFLPCRAPGDARVRDEVFSSKVTGEILSQLKKKYDYILVDLPPLLVMPDARAIASALDNVIYLAEWDSTDRAAIAEALRRSPEIAQRVSGCILNKANHRVIKKYYLQYRYQDRAKAR